jgi:hypothetical protein
MLMRDIIEADDTKKTKTRDADLSGISNIDDLLAEPPNHPIAKARSGGADPSKGPSRASDVPDMPRASAADTARATSGITPTDAMRDMMSRMRVPDDMDLDDDDGVVPQPIEPRNVPAVIRREIANTDPNAINPDWHVVANLPGNMQRAIRQLGRALFSSFTRTPTQDITMIGNVAGQGPNSSRDVRGVMDWVRRNGTEVDTANIDFDQTIPGYEASIVQHTVGGVRFMLVRDQFGEYVYAWPESDSIGSQAQIAGSDRKRLGEAGPWDPRQATQGGKVLQFPPGGKAGAKPVPGTSGIPKVELPKVEPGRVKSFMKMPAIRKLVAKLLGKLWPAFGAYYFASDAYDSALSGRWRDMFINLAGGGLNIASLFGYAAGGVTGAALTAASIAAMLYVERVYLIRAYYDYNGVDTSAYTDDEIYAYADELTRVMAGYIYDELKASAGQAWQWVKSQGTSDQQATP